MVSRADRPAYPAQGCDTAPTSAVGRLFITWRRALTSMVRAAGRALSRDGIGASVQLIAAAWRDPAVALRDADLGVLRTLRSSGVSSLLIGVVGAIALGLAGGASVSTVVITTTGTVIWAFVRLLILRATAPTVVRPTVILGGVWGLGLVPYLFGLTGLLRSVSFAASAWVTYRGARGAGATSRAAGLMIGTAFGSQVAVAFAAWTMRGGTLLFITLASG